MALCLKTRPFIPRGVSRWLQRFSDDVPCLRVAARLSVKPGRGLNDDGAKWVYLRQTWAKEIYAGTISGRQTKITAAAGVRIWLWWQGIEIAQQKPLAERGNTGAAVCSL